jgi:hypothetical protein
MHKIFFSLIALMLLPNVVLANSPNYIKKYVPKAAEVGSGTLSVFLIDVYDVGLYAPQGQWASNKPFALTINYLIDVKSKDIAKESIRIIRKQANHSEAALAKWHTELMRAIPDVKAGDTITGIRTTDGHTIFYKNAEMLSKIDDKDFTDAFFSIWLSQQAENKTLRNKLLKGAQ